MPTFKVGDRVERVGPFVPNYMKNGVVTRVIPNDAGMDWLSEYEVNFGNNQIAIVYEMQLKPAQDAKPN
jgi:hypothetical protein